MPITLNGTNGIIGGIGSATAQNSTSGTSIDFTGIPAGVKRITVMFSGVSTNGTSVPIIQLASNGSVETSGYTGASSEVGNAVATSTVITPSNGIAVQGGFAASISLTGSVVFTLLGSNAWTAIGNVARVAATNVTMIAGGKTTSAAVDRVRITTANGTDTFDAGSINILYE